MPGPTKIARRNTSHNVTVLMQGPWQTIMPRDWKGNAATLLDWAGGYLQSVANENTRKAKTSDLRGFCSLFLEVNGHLRIEDWLPRDTQAYCDHLQELGRKASTVNRALRTLKTFARWVHEETHPVPTPFLHGLPTKGVREIVTDPSEAKKLSRHEITAIFKAADRLVLTATRSNARPRRNRAMLAVLYYTGLRVSELVTIRRRQYRPPHLADVKRKGNRQQKIFVQSAARQALEDYLEHERGDDAKGAGRDAPLFLTARGGVVSRRDVARILDALAVEASTHRAEPVTIHPHALRHTFGSWVHSKTGSDVRTAELLGHTSVKYVGVYVQQTDDEREDLLESMR